MRDPRAVKPRFDRQFETHGIMQIHEGPGNKARAATAARALYRDHTRRKQGRK